VVLQFLIACSIIVNRAFGGEKSLVFRVLLVEFAATAGFHRAEWFPFIKGRLKKSHEVQWVRFGVDPANMLQFESVGVSLNQEDTAVLRRLLDSWNPTHILFGLTPSTNLLKDLSLPAPDCQILHAGPADSRNSKPIASLWEDGPAFPDSDDNVRLLTNLAGQIPDYGWIPGNTAASTTNPLPFLIAGDPCLYNRPFSSNPFLGKQHQGALIRRGGCAFCTRPESDKSVWEAVDPNQAVRDQLEAIALTCPSTNQRLMIRMQGEAPIKHLESTVKSIVQSSLPGSDFLFDCRSDMLGWRFEDFKRALPELKGSTHRIEMSLIGIENFSSKELDRLNKGFDGLTNLKALRILFQLERQWPNHFGFRRHGGLSLITMTPWTEPEELVLNLSITRLLQLEDITGKLLSERLRLYPTLPLYWRAKQDELLTKSYDDPLLDTASLNLYDHEAPWRFTNPVLDNVSKVLLHIENDRVPADFDELTTVVTELALNCRSSGNSVINLARHIVQMAVIRQNLLKTVSSVEDLLDEGRRFVAKPNISHPSNEPPPPSPQDFIRGSDKELKVPLECILDVKPVSKIEPIESQMVNEWKACDSLPNLRLVKRPDTSFYEAFFGKNPKEVSRAIELTLHLNELAQTGIDTDIVIEERQDTISEIGKLLGYPECCSKAMALEASALQDSTFWMHITRRIAAPDEIPFELHPASVGLEYIPCEANCNVALGRARFVLERQREVAPEQFERHIAQLQHPTLLFSDEQGAMVELIPLEDPLAGSGSEIGSAKASNADSHYRFRCQVGKTSLRTPLANYVGLADEIVIERECVTLYREGKPFIPLSGQVFVWWHKHVFQRDFWQAMVEAKRANSHALGTANTTTEVQEIDAATVRAGAFLARVFKQVQDRSFSGYKIVTIVTLSPGEIHVGLEDSDEPLDIIVDIRPNQAAALAKIGRVTLRHPEDSPIRSPAQWRGFRSFRDFIGQLLTERSRQS
jgi:hypothetical protein